MTRPILVLEKDLFFAVRIRDTLQHHGMEAMITRDLAGLLQALKENDARTPALAIIDISTPGVDWEEAIRQVHTRGLPVLAFGSHMDLAARARALAAGAERVVANAKVSSSLPTLVQRLLAGERSSVPSSDEEEEPEP
jgi:DNA-binding response OmpR family regulator